MLLSIDGHEAVATAPYEVVIPTDARVRLGSPGSKTPAVLADVPFATD